ncbi:MAG: disulfide bond formation protein B [Micavibrio sp.]|nr:MAG: disulfide bond formation protein B [Micavibrio sp.]
MKALLTTIHKLLLCPIAFFGGVLALSIFAVSAAIASEVFLGLEPCRLCIYQRWGFAVTGLLAALGLLLFRKNPLHSAVLAALTGLAFLGNAAVAFYHTGVEQKWWVSQVEGCTIPNFDMDSGAQSWLDNIMSAPSKPCDVIAWQDPLLGLSMANYNLALCFGMALICAIAAVLYFRKSRLRTH